MAEKSSKWITLDEQIFDGGTKRITRALTVQGGGCIVNVTNTDHYGAATESSVYVPDVEIANGELVAHPMFPTLPLQVNIPPVIYNGGVSTK